MNPVPDEVEIRSRSPSTVTTTGTSSTEVKPRRFLNGWCKEHERLMSDWSDISVCYRWIHDQSEKYYHSRSLWINIPVIVLSTLGGTANFGIQALFQDETIKKYASFGIGGISLFAGLLTTVGNYLRFAQLEEAHRVASIAWGKFQRLIAIELALHPNERMDALDFLKVCRVDLDRLIEQAPPIPQSSIDRFGSKFGSIRDLKRPDICGGLEHTHVFDSSEMRLKQLAVDAALMLKHKKNALKELWSPQMEQAIRQEVDRQIDDALERNRIRALSMDTYPTSPLSLITKRDAILQNIVVVPSSPALPALPALPSSPSPALPSSPDLPALSVPPSDRTFSDKN